MIERFEHFTYATNEITKFWRKLAGDEMKKHGLKSPHAIYFTVLANHTETGLTATQMCELSGRDKADVSRMFALMEEKGLVVKKGVHQNLYNLNYYKSIITALNIEPQECLMVRNDIGEDMVAQDLGMKVFLITDCLINKTDKDISAYPNEDFADLIEFMKGL